MSARLRRAAVAIAGCGLAAFVSLVFATSRPADPRLWPPVRGAPVVTITLANHGWHTGFIAPRQTLFGIAVRDGLPALLQVATRFAAYDNLEIGWGNERFYRTDASTPLLERAQLGLAALAGRGGGAALHVVGLSRPARASFPSSELVDVDLSPEGAARLAQGIDATFDTQALGDVEELGQGIYGPSLFYRARGAFSLVNVCNQWVSRLLARAGLPRSPALVLLPEGLLWRLRWSGGDAVRLEPPAR